jgi:60 kDa SS-A/Ro ribonucleoprotein
MKGKIMANKSVFASTIGKLLPKTDAVNHSGSNAYALSPEAALAQYAATGCINGTFYATAEAQVEKLMDLAKACDPAFIAKTAIYSRQKGFMKDTPALLTAWIAQHAPHLLKDVFPQTIDNGKMLRNFVQIIRSGVVGRKSLGTAPKKLVQRWLNGATEAQLLSASVGQSPSLADVVKMVHVKPREAWREAFFGWLIGRPYKLENLPAQTAAFELFKYGQNEHVPDVPFQMLTSQPLTKAHWIAIAEQMSWTALRMNLNTLARNGVFEASDMTAKLAARIADRNSISKAKVFPYQLMTTFNSLSDDVPSAIKNALQDAMEVALENVPTLAGKVVVCPDVSGSMASPVTGYRPGSTTVTRCIDVAGLVAAAFLRKHNDAIVLPFENDVVKLELNARDSILTNAKKLASIGGGGTNCSAPLRLMNQKRIKADLVVMVSDNESWMDATRHGATATMREWEVFKRANPDAKLVCIDVQPYATTQAQERNDILNIGGFSDSVFDVVAAFAAGQLTAGHWVDVINDSKLVQ